MEFYTFLLKIFFILQLVRKIVLLYIRVYVVILFAGPLSGTGLEGHIFDKMPNRDANLPPFPDYELLFLSVAHDNFFYEQGLQLYLREDVRS